MQALGLAAEVLPGTSTSESLGPSPALLLSQLPAEAP